MRGYEALVIFSSLGASAALQGGKTLFEEAVRKHGGKVLNRSELGKRLTGYSLKKAKEGYFVSFAFELPPEKIDALKQALQLTEDILKFTITKKLKAGKLLRSKPSQSQVLSTTGKR
ncbi:MAG: 30S ribosomal protein S6 [Candidatus Omnitrophica bacterium]|nr:30S ribosomal protein S6 [Candidatus Omnitrophota bacterium]